MESRRSSISSVDTDVLQTVHARNMDSIVSSSINDSKNQTQDFMESEYEINERASKAIRNDPWNFISKNKDLLQRNVFQSDGLDQYERKTYRSYSEVPSVSEIFDAIRARNKIKHSILTRRKTKFAENENKPRSTFVNIVNKQTKSHALKKRRLSVTMSPSSADQKIAQLIEVTRTEPEFRSDKSLQVLKNWMMENCRQDSIVSTFLRDCDFEDGNEFCRHLQYQIFTKNEAIVRQNAYGYSYFIILTGECNIYVNNYLLGDEIADPIRSDRQGIGEYIDRIKQGVDFGEFALLNNQKRSATILAATPTVECLVCLQSEFKKCLEAHTEKETSKMVRNMKKNYIFRNTANAYLRMLFQRFRKVTIEEGKLLQHQSHSIQKVYLVTSGKCREFILVKDKNGKTRKEYISEFNEGDAIIGGYYAIVNKKPISSIVTVTGCECLAISKSLWVKSITTNMQSKLLSIGETKHHFIKKSIVKFENLLKDISIRFRKSKSEEEQKREMQQFQNEYARHGKWGRHEQKAMDKFISSQGLKQKVDTVQSENVPPTTKSIYKQTKLFSMSNIGIDDINDYENEALSTRREATMITSGRSRVDFADNKDYYTFDDDYSEYDRFSDLPTETISAPMTHRTPATTTAGRTKKTRGTKQILVTVPSIERIAIRIRSSPSKKQQRFTHNSAVIGGLFDYEHDHNTKHQIKETIKRPHTTQQMVRSEGQPENPYDVDGETKTTEQLATKYMNDCMSANILSLSRHDVSDANVYSNMVRAINERHHTRQDPNLSIKTVELPTFPQFKTKRRVKTEKRKLRRTFHKFPILKAKTLRKSKSRQAFGRTTKPKSKTKMRKSRSRTQVKIKKDRCGHNHYAVDLRQNENPNIDLEVSEWIDYDDVMKQIDALHVRYDAYMDYNVADTRNKLMRSGSSPDVLIKYHTRDHPRLLKEYVNRLGTSSSK